MKLIQIYPERVRQVLAIRDPNEERIKVGLISCNNVAPGTNLCLGRATTRSHSSQWSKKKVAVET